MKMKKNNTYMQVISGGNGDAGEILLYGYIGQDYWWWPEKDEESITDISFRKAFNELAEKYNRINIRINSPGGSLLHGNAIISTIMNSPVEVHTYNDGMAASMAASIWLSAENRHMGVNATLMLHNTMNGIWGNAKELRQMADTLDKFTSTTASLIANRTGMDEDEVKEMFFNDYEDHWLTRQECDDMGFITAKDDKYENEEMVSQAQAKAMSYDQLVAQFSDMEKKVNNAPWWRRAAAVFTGNSDNKTAKEMKIEDLKASLESGELTAEEVQQLLADSTASSSEPQPANEEQEARMAALETAMQNLTNQFTQAVKDIQQELQQMGSKPAAKPTTPAADADIDDQELTLQQQYQKDLETQAQMAEEWRNPFAGYME